MRIDRNVIDITYHIVERQLLESLDYTVQAHSDCDMQIINRILHRIGLLRTLAKIMRCRSCPLTDMVEVYWLPFFQ